MHRIHDEQATVVIALGGDTDALASARDLGSCLNGHDSITIRVDASKVGGVL